MLCTTALFLDGIEPFCGRQFSMWQSTKKFSSIFDLGPLTLKIYSPKFYRPLFTGAAIGQSRTRTCVMAATGNLCTQRLACGADLTTLALGTESNRLPACLVIYLQRHVQLAKFLQSRYYYYLNTLTLDMRSSKMADKMLSRRQALGVTGGKPRSTRVSECRQFRKSSSL